MPETFLTPANVISHLTQIFGVCSSGRDHRFPLNPCSRKNNIARKSCLAQPCYLSLASEHKGTEQDFSDYFSGVFFFPPLTTEFTHKKERHFVFKVNQVSVQFFTNWNHTNLFFLALMCGC